ncbi:hypothetical protein CORC01_02824 [Colletotrichum orchidophilum]|uniref:Uncharacterized protein n=1 Tax=Colletotrichum orchidophilum TaxID=1209926 RepID=A0A1G4BKV5_9PEZI|nr:uncharacterized protein CORC01_02824 [Colletotrichum orchidophilum]OHF01946.1 hypothetical protein CORC01_02824 [Colletotrichum orchidophilum]
MYCLACCCTQVPQDTRGVDSVTIRLGLAASPCRRHPKKLPTYSPNLEVMYNMRPTTVYHVGTIKTHYCKHDSTPATSNLLEGGYPHNRCFLEDREMSNWPWRSGEGRNSRLLSLWAPAQSITESISHSSLIPIHPLLCRLVSGGPNRLLHSDAQDRSQPLE